MPLPCAALGMALAATLSALPASGGALPPVPQDRYAPPVLNKCAAGTTLTLVVPPNQWAQVAGVFFHFFILISDEFSAQCRRPTAEG